MGIGIGNTTGGDALSSVEHLYQYVYRINGLRIDESGEFTSQTFIAYCQKHGVIRQITQPHTPHQNGVVERKNRTLFDLDRSIAQAVNLPKFL